MRHYQYFQFIPLCQYINTYSATMFLDVLVQSLDTVKTPCRLLLQRHVSSG